MTKNKLRIAVSVLLLVIGATVVCGAAQMTVKVSGVEGTVEMKKTDAGQWAAVKNGDTVPVGGAIRTSAGSSCMLTWADGNALKVSALSALVVSAADRADNGTEKSTLDLKQGKVFAHVKKLQTADSKFELKTPTAVAGVRGTDMYGTMEPGAGASFGVTEGSVAVEAGGTEVMLDPGFSVAVDMSGALSDIVPIPDNIKQEVDQSIKQVRQEAKAETKSEAKEEKKEEKKEAKEQKEEKKEEVKAEKQETKSEEKQESAPVADEKPAAQDDAAATDATSDAITDNVTQNVEQALDDDIINTVNDDIERIYRTGTVDVEIYFGE